MILRTEITPPVSDLHITHRDGIALCGSCFTENIGAKFFRYRFRTSINSHGIIFNPESLAGALIDAIEKRIYTERDLFFDGKRFLSFNHHGKFSSDSAQEVLRTINSSIDETHGFLKLASVLFVTFGSAWAYEDKDTDDIVANCHKLPQQRFRKILLDHHRIENKFDEVILKLHQLNPGIRIVFTVSPVRHWRDGATENQLSKSNLIIACHNLVKSASHLSYFPAYELMMDDLRDYRFYTEDMLHPTSQAVDYIWQKLINWSFHEETRVKLLKMEPLLLYNEHRPIDASRLSEYLSRVKDNEKVLAGITKT